MELGGKFFPDKIKNKINRIKQGLAPAAEPEASIQRILPWDVRVAIRYGVKLDPSHIESLLNSGFINESIYLTTKALGNDKEKQLTFLSELTDQIVQDPKNLRAAKQVIDKAIKTIDKSYAVNGTKLAQVSRQGFDFWDKKFEELSSDEVQIDSTPILIAYASLIGIRHFIVDPDGTARRTFMIMVPDYIQDNKEQICVYIITPTNPKGERVSYLPKNFQRPDNYLFIDDAVRTGKHKEDIWEFWNKDKGSNNTLDAARFRTLVHVPV